MAKCWLATWTKRSGLLASIPISMFHPDKCGFCEVPRDLLIQMLEEFQSWSGISKYDDESPLRMELEQWSMLNTAEQNRLVAKRQGFNQPDRGRDPDDHRSPW